LRGIVMDSLKVSVSGAAMAVALIAYGFLQVYG
jgi:hypothetical protein